jgi:hypothetical protein
MNKVFDIKRFGKYFTYDLNNALGNYGISALVIGLMPLILLVFSVIFSLIITGEVIAVPLPVKLALFGISVLVVILSAPTKLYGSLTERRAGTDWLMLPASSFEKFLSMAIMLCIVLPLVVFGLFVVCDLLLGWIVPAYGGSAFKALKDGISSNNIDMMLEEMSLVRTTTGGTLASVFMGWCATVLPFGLGAICFKKGKAAKTILCILGVEILFSILLVILFKGGYEGGFELGQRMADFFGNLTAEKAQFWANFLINLMYLVIVGGLLTAIFFRIKTIKH